MFQIDYYRSKKSLIEKLTSCSWDLPNFQQKRKYQGVKNFTLVARPYTWRHYRARELYVRGLPSTIEEMLHVRALPCTWATRELYVRGSPPPLRECYTWGHYHACEPHVRGSPSPLRKCYTWGHYRAREPHMRGSPPPMRKCYMWGHYHAREPHVSCTWGAPLHHWGNATCEGITMHVSHTWGAPLHHWGNATHEGITVHVSHTWAVREGLPSTIEGMLHVRALPCTWATRDSRVCAQLPSTFQKKWPKNSPSTT